MSDYENTDFDEIDRLIAEKKEAEQKEAWRKEHEEWKHKEAEREKQEKAFSDSLRTDKTKKEVKWLSKIIDNDGLDLVNDFLSDSFDNTYNALDFLEDLIKVGAVKKNIMMALMGTHLLTMGMWMRVVMPMRVMLLKCPSIAYTWVNGLCLKVQPS